MTTGCPEPREAFAFVNVAPETLFGAARPPYDSRVQWGTRGNMFVRRIATLCSISVVVLGLNVAPAAADDGFPYVTPVNSRYSHSYEHWGRGPAWNVRGYGPGVLALDRAVEASNTFSSVVGITANEVTAAVGFDVTHSETFTAKFEADLPDRGPWMLEAGTVDEVFVFDIQEHDGCTGIPVGITGEGQGRADGRNHLPPLPHLVAPGRRGVLQAPAVSLPRRRRRSLPHRGAERPFRTPAGLAPAAGRGPGGHGGAAGV
jgi:hypothetical protein